MTALRAKCVPAEPQPEAQAVQGGLSCTRSLASKEATACKQEPTCAFNLRLGLGSGVCVEMNALSASQTRRKATNRLSMNALCLWHCPTCVLERSCTQPIIQTAILLSLCRA